MDEKPLKILTAAVQAVQHGAQDYLAKSDINSTFLVRSLRHAIERQRLWIELQRKAIALENSEARRRDDIQVVPLDMERIVAEARKRLRFQIEQCEAVR